MSLQDLIILNEKCEEYEKEIAKLQTQNKELVDAIQGWLEDLDTETVSRNCKDMTRLLAKVRGGE